MGQNETLLPLFIEDFLEVCPNRRMTSVTMLFKCLGQLCLRFTGNCHPPFPPLGIGILHVRLAFD
jgi:hypothetical protein